MVYCIVDLQSVNANFHVPAVSISVESVFVCGRNSWKMRYAALRDVGY